MYITVVIKGLKSKLMENEIKTTESVTSGYHSLPVLQYVSGYKNGILKRLNWSMMS